MTFFHGWWRWWFMTACFFDTQFVCPNQTTSVDCFLPPRNPSYIISFHIKIRNHRGLHHYGALWVHGQRTKTGGHRGMTVACPRSYKVILTEIKSSSSVVGCWCCWINCSKSMSASTNK
ncbi:hypothetical protein L1987_09582 [Smallanthus sonchifolius]|uniref:Uncharacterized protein n=1 Tax=Smallanthus sonchifolius TaxID=185202 RepID=A0ACB9JPQ5_9ASTR|nr:hypothetical protein L1987_09582 [Smallanthus sonchifolius]